MKIYEELEKLGYEKQPRPTTDSDFLSFAKLEGLFEEGRDQYEINFKKDGFVEILENGKHCVFTNDEVIACAKILEVLEGMKND